MTALLVAAADAAYRAYETAVMAAAPDAVRDPLRRAFLHAEVAARPHTRDRLHRFRETLR